MNLDLMVFIQETIYQNKRWSNPIRLDDKQSKETHWFSLFIAKNTVVCFDSFGIKYIPQEVINKIKDKSITQSIFRIQNDDSVMCGF